MKFPESRRHATPRIRAEVRSVTTEETGTKDKKACLVGAEILEKIWSQWEMLPEAKWERKKCPDFSPLFTLQSPTSIWCWETQGKARAKKQVISIITNICPLKQFLFLPFSFSSYYLYLPGLLSKETSIHHLLSVFPTTNLLRNSSESACESSVEFLPSSSLSLS